MWQVTDLGNQKKKFFPSEKLAKKTAALSSLPATKKVLQAIVPIKKRPQRQGAERLLKTRRSAEQKPVLALSLFNFDGFSTLN